MQFFRVTKNPVKAEAFDGVGSSIYPGRWNERGRRAVYVASQIPLAVLEILVQTGPTAHVGYVVYPVTVPEGALLKRFDRGKLTTDWRKMVGRDQCRQFGEEWRAAGNELGLIVPSAIIPEAYEFDSFNVVLNPEHPSFSTLDIGDPMALELDSRIQDSLALRGKSI